MLPIPNQWILNLVLQTLGDLADIDGNGDIDALTDGLAHSALPIRFTGRYAY